MKKILVLMLSVLLFTSCKQEKQERKQTITEIKDKVKEESNKVIKKTSPIIKELYNKSKEIIKDTTEVINEDKDFQNLKGQIKEYTQYKLSKKDNYYKVVGKSNIDENLLKGNKIIYGTLDKLGRPTFVRAKLDYELIEKERQEKREPIEVNPIGWGHNKKVSIKSLGNVYNGFFWNRSHLLADSLGGLPIKENLITGTRMQNVGIKNKGGMAYTETKAREYFKNYTKEKMYYFVECVYNGNEIIPRYVIINIKTTDNKIDEKVIVYNEAEGFEIDYNTGKFKEK